MADIGDEPEGSAGDGAEAQSLSEEVRVLFEAARARAETELAFQKARAGLLGKWAGIVAALGCLVVALLFLALMAAVFGVVLGLAQALGAWAATGIVVGVLVVLALVAGLLAWARVRRIGALFGDRP
ncbi:MAG: phage holin family protein [Sphingomonadales bacterium]|nr:phage holin family protein [Sphingomonadales bacterium]